MVRFGNQLNPKAVNQFLRCFKLHCSIHILASPTRSQTSICLSVWQCCIFSLSGRYFLKYKTTSHGSFGRDLLRSSAQANRDGSTTTVYKWYGPQEHHHCIKKHQKVLPTSAKRTKKVSASCILYCTAEFSKGGAKRSRCPENSFYSQMFKQRPSKIFILITKSQRFPLTAYAAEL